MIAGIALGVLHAFISLFLSN